MVHSILDNDLYKLSMGYAVFKKFPEAKVEYTFIDRDDVDYPRGFGDELRKRVSNMRLLKLTPEEKKYLLDNVNIFHKLTLIF